MIEVDFPIGPIPERLQCAYCKALAQDARRLACCDSTICADCKLTYTLTLRCQRQSLTHSILLHRLQ